MDLSLILPAFNERESIGSTIDQAFSYFQSRSIRAEIIVAADGNDGTREFVREKTARTPNLTVIGHEQRCGKGRGIREAVAIARGRIIGYIDADNKVPLEDYDKLRPWVEEGYEVVTGSRGLAGSQIDRYQPWYRRIGSQGFFYFMQAVVGLPGIHDTQCGFKFFPRTVAQQLFRLQQIDGYMFDVEILAIAQRLGYRIKEVPIRWRDDGDSRLQLFSGNLRNAIDVFKIRRFVSRINEVPAAMTAAAGDD